MQKATNARPTRTGTSSWPSAPAATAAATTSPFLSHWWGAS